MEETVLTLGQLRYGGLLGWWLSKNAVPGGFWIYIGGFVLSLVLAYLLGSINFGIIVSKYKYGDDIRRHGSGNAGMTNMMRTYGKSAAFVTLLGDALKAAVAILIARYLLCGEYGAYLAGLGCLIGHAYPCYFGFRGGKGVVVTAATVLMLNPIVFLCLFVLFAVIVLWTKYISLGSIVAMLAYPIVLANVQSVMGVGSENGRNLSVLFALATAAFVIWLHRSNIRRLMKGEESKFSFKKSVKPGEKPAEETPVPASPAEEETERSGSAKQPGKKKKKK